MSDKNDAFEEPAGFSYAIQIKGHLEPHWSDWLGGLEITPDGHGNSTLTGIVPDQAALHGILNQVRDLGLTLISISPLAEDAIEKRKTKKTIEASQNNTYAGLGRRMKAFAYDYLVISAYILLVTGITLAAARMGSLLGVSLGWPEDPIVADLLVFVIVVLPVVLYFALQESTSKQSTWGKRRVGIRVVNARGGRLTRRQAFVRSLVKIIPWQIAHTSIFHIPGWPMSVMTVPSIAVFGFAMAYLLAALYIASVFFSRKHRTPYDLVSGSYVVIEA